MPSLSKELSSHFSSPHSFINRDLMLAREGEKCQTGHVLLKQLRSRWNCRCIYIYEAWSIFLQALVLPSGEFSCIDLEHMFSA